MHIFCIWDPCDKDQTKDSNTSLRLHVPVAQHGDATHSKAGIRELGEYWNGHCLAQSKLGIWCAVNLKQKCS